MDLRIFRLARAGGIDTNPTTFTQRAGTFASAVAQNGAATLLTRRESTGLHGYVILDGKTVAANAPIHLAHTVGARAEETEIPTDLADSPAIGQLVYRNSPALRETQSGIDPTELPRILANALPADSWVAVSMRAPSNKERKRYSPWLANRLGTATPVHHSTSPAAMVISIIAGGSSHDEVRSVLAQVTAGLPGFDLDSDVIFPAARHRAAIGAFIAPALTAAAFIGVPFIPADVVALAPAAFSYLTPVLLGLAVIFGIASAGAFTGKLLSPDTKLRSVLETASFPEPPARRGKVHPPRKEQTIRRTGSNGQSYEKRIAASDGDYPLAPESFLLGPNVVVGMVSPHAGAISGVASTRARSTPPDLLQDIGPLLGSNDDGSPHLSAAALLFGTAIVGQPGSGKAESLDARFPVPVSDRFPTGWALNRELVLGDKVFTPEGKTTTATGFSPVFDGDMYELTFSDGQKVRTDAGHLWAVSSRVTRRRDGSAVHAGRMEEVDRRAALEAHRLRDIAAAIEPGTVAAGNDMARISGIGAEVLLRFARQAGIDSVAARVPVRDAGVFAVNKPRVRFDGQAAGEALRALAKKPSSNIGQNMNLDGLAPEPGILKTAREALAVCGSSDASTIEVSQMNQRLKTAGVPRVRDNHAELIPAKATVRTLEVYPLREVITRYADHIEAGKDRAPRVQLRTTAQLAEAVRVSAEDAVNWAVDTTRPLVGEEIDAPLDPYLIGAWLGNGHSNSPAITCFDQPILDELVTAGCQLSARTAPGLYGILGVVDKFRSLDLINNKHIPSAYLRASFEQRLAVLQGLMDTDGTVDANGACELSVCHERLAADALDLIRSLGIKCKSTPSDASYVDKNGNKKITSTRHRMHFTTALPVFRLPRKLDRLNATIRSTQDVLYITGITKAESEKVRCISVEAADGMYLTHGFIPTHNSLLVRSLFGWHCLERVRPSGRPGYPGHRNTLIAFESKGDGVAKYVSWAHSMGDKILVIDTADPATPGIDMFAVPGDNAARAVFFVNAMKYTFGREAIGDRSFETLTGVFTAALAVDQALLDSMEDRDERAIEANRSPIYYAYLLLGGRGDAIGVELAAAIKSLAVKMRERETPNAVLEQAYGAIASLYEGRTESARRPFLEAPRNKVSAMLDLESWWSPSRRKVKWSEVLEGHRSVVINTGSSPSGAVLEENQNQMISSMLMFSLKNAMVRHCSGWLELGRSVTVFADELSLLAGTSPEIISWIRDQGRSYGIRAILATQRPEQLGAALRNNFLTYTTLISFAQTDVTTAGEVSSNVGTGDWSVDDIQHLEPYNVVVRTSVDQRRQAAFIVKLPNFEANMSAYPAAQGYARPTTGAVPSAR